MQSSPPPTPPSGSLFCFCRLYSTLCYYVVCACFPGIPLVRVKINYKRKRTS